MNLIFFNVFNYSEKLKKLKTILKIVASFLHKVFKKTSLKILANY